MSIYGMTNDILSQEESRRMAILAEFAGSAERLDELMQIQFERNAKAQKETNPLIEHVWIEETFMGETLPGSV